MTVPDRGTKDSRSRAGDGLIRRPGFAWSFAVGIGRRRVPCVPRRFSSGFRHCRRIPGVLVPLIAFLFADADRFWRPDPHLRFCGHFDTPLEEPNRGEFASAQAPCEFKPLNSDELVARRKVPARGFLRAGTSRFVAIGPFNPNATFLVVHGDVRVEAHLAPLQKQHEPPPSSLRPKWRNADRPSHRGRSTTPYL